MPTLVLTNPGVMESVTRPVVMDIIRQLYKWTGLPEKTPIRFPGDTGVSHQPGSTIENAPDYNQFDTHSRWGIEIEEDHQEERGLSMAVLYDDNPFYFDDEDARVFIKPAYSPCTVTIRINARFTDREQAVRARDDIRTRVGMLREAFVHKTSYSYLVPLEFVHVLEVIHSMREQVQPYGQTLDEYLKFYFSPKARLLANLAGKETQWGVAETQAKIIGYFDFDLVPDKNEKNDENSSHSIGFTYTFKYDKPIASVMSYPLVINNQLIDKKYRRTTAEERIEDTLTLYSLSAAYLSHFENYRQTQDIAMPGVSIPEFDEFIPNKGSVPLGTLRLFTGLTTIDTDSPLDLLRLDQLGTHDIDPEILEFIRGERHWIRTLGMSTFHLSVYRNHHLMHKDKIELGDDLMVRLTEPPNLRDVYHVRLALYQRPRMLPSEAKERLRNSCSVTRKILKALKPKIEEMGLLPTCMVGNYMSREDFNKAVDEIDRQFDSKFNGNLYQFNTVMTLFLKTDRAQPVAA